MRISLRQFFWGLSLVLLFSLVAQSAGKELIEPTRTLQSPENKYGKLSVFSEPPELDVFLDQSIIGKTPILSLEVTPGIHTLKVDTSETDIDIIADQTLRLSLFRGNFIAIKEPTEEKIQKQEEDTTQKKSTEPMKEEKGYKPEYDPAYWPLNPGGPIK